MGLKTFTTDSMNVLLSSVAKVKSAADGCLSAVSALGNDFRKLTEHVTDAVEEMDTKVSGKQDKSIRASCTIPKTGWKSDNTSDYKNYYDIPAEGITADDYVSLVILPASIRTAIGCGFCPVCESMDKVIRVRAFDIPSAEMSATYYIEKGV